MLRLLSISITNLGSRDNLPRINDGVSVIHFDDK